MRDFIHFTQPFFGEEEKKEILEVLDSGWVTLGPRTKQFEENFAKYVGAKYAVGVTSCTAALHLSLVAAGIGQGDEVITTPFTFVASINPIIHVGASPVLVDIDEKTFNIDVSKIEEKITPKTKAIIPVHYAGQPCDMDELRKIAKKHNLIIIEDAAHGLGAEYKGQKIGSIGDFTCFSFHAIKNISTGDGGMVTTNNEVFANKLMQLRLHGMNRDAWKRHTKEGSWKYDIEYPGFKYNMTDIAAALGLHQLKKLPDFTKAREKYAQIYNKELSPINEITVPYVGKDVKVTRVLYTIKIDADKLKIDRDQIVEKLKQEQVGANVQFIPVYHFTYYQKKFGFKPSDFPVTEKVYPQILSLPLFPKMKEEDVHYVAKTLKKIIIDNRK